MLYQVRNREGETIAFTNDLATAESYYSGETVDHEQYQIYIWRRGRFIRLIDPDRSGQGGRIDTKKVDFQIRGRANALDFLLVCCQVFFIFYLGKKIFLRSEKLP